MNAAAPFFLAAAALALPAATALAAPSVALQGMLGKSALLVIDGGTPRTLAPGQSWQGVKVIATSGDTATVEIDGQRRSLRVGEAPSRVQGVAPRNSANKFILTADARGHFFTGGFINNRPIRFMVDTGASFIALSEAMAEAAGLDYKNAQRVTMNTANGQAQGWARKRAQVRVGDVTIYNVDAVITPAPMPAALLGNSFLNHFAMQRNGSRMEFTRR